MIAGALDVDVIDIADLDEQDWIGAWQQQVEPIEIGGVLSIVPAEAAGQSDPATAVLLNMGLAFGTGRHPTTRLCLEWLGAESVTGACVLDYGCGSGVLALAALKRGADFVYATDNDEQALIATAGNATLNGMRERLWIGPPETLPDEQIDLLLANILAGTLQDCAATLTQRQTRGGRLVLSGILEAQADRVIAAFEAGYTDFAVAALDGWVRISARRH
jgi:ribosomal protein L11 methyltransferase